MSIANHPHPDEDYRIDKDPEARLDYSFNWTDWLTGGEVISAAVWTIPAASGLTQFSGSVFTNTHATVFLADGIVGDTYGCECKITTNSVPARTDERTLWIRVLER